MHTRNTIVMALLFVLLAGFVYFYEVRGRAGREEEERQAELLLDFEVEKVAGLTLESADERVVANRQDGDWSIVEPRPIEADDAAFDTLVDNLQRATHERIVTEEPDDLAPFGLDQPAVRVTIRLEDGSEQTLSVGKDTPVGFNLYAVAGAGPVYSAPRALRGQVAKTLLDLRDRTVLWFDTAAVRRLELARPGFRVEMAFDPAAGDGGVWTMEAPASGRADDETVDDLLADLQDAEVESFVVEERPDEAALAGYGLADPWLRVGVRTGDDAWSRLLVGAESDEPAGRYAMREGGDAVFVVASDVFDGVPTDADALRNRQVVAVTRARVRALEIDAEGSAMRVERADGGADWRLVRPRALAADSSAVSRLLTAVENLRAEGFGGEVGEAALRVSLEVAAADAAAEPERIELSIGRATRSITPLDGGEDAEPIEVRPVTTGTDPTVYWVDAEELTAFDVEPFDLRDKTLVEFVQEDLARLEISSPDGATATIERDGETWSTGGEPVDAESIDDVLWELNYLRMESVAADDASTAPADWGVASPRFRIVVHDAAGVVAEVAVGGEAPGGDDGTDRVYATVAGHPGVFTIGAGLADTLAALVEDLAG